MQADCALLVWLSTLHTAAGKVDSNGASAPLLAAFNDLLQRMGPLLGRSGSRGGATQVAQVATELFADAQAVAALIEQAWEATGQAAQ
jgi:hypothetical protein